VNSSDTLLKAAINRITARLGEKITDAATEMTSLALEAPELLKKEWEILKEEIYTEAERLKKDDDLKEQNSTDPKNSSEIDSPIERIDQIRARVAELNQKIESQN
tara:strand:+ start:2849 stop:3163 length:315 start_codon:yes stop_codon:yes gene_type:complete